MQIRNLLSSSNIPISIFLTSFLIFELLPGNAVAQEPIFELPVQLVGFPFIIGAVRLTNFFKKLGYSLNPKTYVPAIPTDDIRRRRDTSSNHTDLYDISRTAVDLTIAEKRILSELGTRACVLEEPCKIHANKRRKVGEQPDWSDILRNYKVQSSGMKQWYLLSVFLGDIIKDVSLCKQLAKRLSCERFEKPIIRD